MPPTISAIIIAPQSQITAHVLRSLLSWPAPSITLLSIFLLIACGFRKLAGHGVECQAMAAEY